MVILNHSCPFTGLLRTSASLLSGSGTSKSSKRDLQAKCSSKCSMFSLNTCPYSRVRFPTRVMSTKSLMKILRGTFSAALSSSVNLISYILEVIFRRLNVMIIYRSSSDTMAFIFLTASFSFLNLCCHSIGSIRVVIIKCCDGLGSICKYCLKRLLNSKSQGLRRLS